MFEKAVRRQENIEAVIGGALPLLSEKSSAEDIHEDWLNRFVDNAERISDKDVQSLWSKILAGEANTPGKFGVRTLEILSNMDRQDAQVFQQLATLCLNIENDSFFAVVPDPFSELVKETGLNFELLGHLDSIGLITFNNVTGFSFSVPQNKFCIYREQGIVGMACTQKACKA